jgi:hypothetical protein
LGLRTVTGSAKNQSAQVAALIAAADYVEAKSRPSPFTARARWRPPGTGVKELGEKLRSLADIRSHGGIVPHQEIEGIVGDLNRLGFFFDEKIWGELTSAFPPEC